MKFQRMRHILPITLCFLLGIGLLISSVHMVSHAAQPEPAVTIASSQWANKIGIYHPGETPGLHVTLKNEESQSHTGDVRITLSEPGNKIIWQDSTPFDLTAGQETTLIIPTLTMPNSGWFEARIEAVSNGRMHSSLAGLSVVRNTTTQQIGPLIGSNYGTKALPPRPTGLLPNSYFGLDMRHEADQDIHRQIAKDMGVRWTRGAKHGEMNIVSPSPNTYWNQSQIDTFRNEVTAWNNNGVSVLGTTFYGPCWNVDPSLACHETKPTDMQLQAETIYRLIEPNLDLVQNWELHNEPWVHGWAWKTGDAQDYRNYSKAIWDRVKPDLPNANLIGSGSVPYSRDVVYAKNSSDTGYIDGSVNHAYGIPDPGQMGTTALQAQLDKLYSQSDGHAGAWQTELGVREGDFPGSLTEQRQWVARSMAPTYLLQILGATSQDHPVRVFWFSLGYNVGYSGDEYNLYDGTNPKPAVSAYSVMTHTLEGKEMVGDLYPNSKGLWGFLFEDANGNGSAAIYADREYSGNMTINNASGIGVYNYLGSQVSDGSQSTLNLTLNPWETFYLVSNKPVNDFKSQLQNAAINLSTDIKVEPLSFDRAVTTGNTIDVKVENVSSRTISSTLTLTPPAGWTLSSNNLAINNLAPGEKRVLSFPTSAVSIENSNRYTVGYSLAINGEASPQTGQQVIQAAFAPKKTFNVDGNLGDWSDVTAVNTGNGNYQVKTAWDDNNFYFAAEITDTTHQGNLPFDQDPYAFPFLADSVQLAFDVLANNPDDLLKGQTLYEKGMAADVDYEFIATLAQGNIPELHRHKAPGTNYQTYYPTNGTLTPALGPMQVTTGGSDEGKIQILRDGNKTMYEIAVDWSAIPELETKVKALNTGQVGEMNFAFKVNGGDSGTAYWTQEAGQVHSGSYGFSPHWGGGQKQNGGRIITRWGLIGGSDSCTNCPGNGTGLTAQYYDNINFTNLKTTRTDTTINFNWDTSTPSGTALTSGDTFSVRWTGQVQPQYSQTYTLYTTSDDGVRLWVNGQQVINNWTDHGPTENSGTINLTAGQKYDITMEFYENGGGATATLSWSSSSQSKQIIPISQLYPTSTA